MTRPGFNTSFPVGLASRKQQAAVAAEAIDASGIETARPPMSHVRTTPSALPPAVSDPPAASVRPFDENATQRPRCPNAFTVAEGLTVL